ncbi:hypothetical protein FTW19_03270 [Terriglobus albidus]|uniref:VWA domain-containing protein n=1 Tax=Terriglobus albidus TaxID=1592106 RepID=A0A5B9E543_9BACT|nr:VWA domain-containing protein [Terriglobus albidus]QEE27118.1 hypothetical protein FTW19_03270 [Terriglobus albidus]
MNMRWKVVCILLWALATGASAQDAPVIRREARLVLVPVLVTGKDGLLSEPLTAKDFFLTDDGAAMNLRLEDRSSQPLAVLVVMQTGGSAPRQFRNYSTLETMLQYVAGAADCRFGLLTFDSKPEGVLRFSRDVSRLHDPIQAPETGDGSAAILDAVSTGVDLLAALPQTTRRVILLLSQPQDTASKTPVHELLRKMSENNVEVYSLTFSPEKTQLMDSLKGNRHANPPYQLGPVGPTVMGTFDLGTPLGMAFRALQKNAASEMAELSGGESFRFDDRAELEKQMAILANHLPNRYLLSFQPVSGKEGLHRIEVRIPAHPDLTVHARNAYWSSASTPAHLP